MRAIARGFVSPHFRRCRHRRHGGGPDDLPQRQAHRPAPGAVLLLRQRGLRRRPGRRATSSPAGRGSRRGARSRRTSRSIIQPSFEGGRNLSSVTTTCTSSEVPDGGGTPTITCRTTGRSGLRLRDAYIDVRFTQAANKSAFYLRAGQEKRPVSRYELTSSNNLPSIERGAGQGLLARASNDLFSSRRLPLPRRGREPAAGAQAGRPAAGDGQGRRLQRAGREPQRREQQEELRRPGHRRRHAQARRRRLLVRPRRHRDHRTGCSTPASPTAPSTSTPSRASRATRGSSPWPSTSTARTPPPAKLHMRGIQGTRGLQHPDDQPDLVALCGGAVRAVGPRRPGHRSRTTTAPPRSPRARRLHVEQGVVPGGLRAAELPGGGRARASAACGACWRSASEPRRTSGATDSP